VGDDAEFGLRLGESDLDIEPGLPAVFQAEEGADPRVRDPCGGRERIAHAVTSLAITGRSPRSSFQGPSFKGPSFKGPSFKGPSFKGPALKARPCAVRSAACVRQRRRPQISPPLWVPPHRGLPLTA